MSKAWTVAALLVLTTACQSAGTPDPAPTPSAAFPSELDRSPNLGVEFWENGHRAPLRVRDGVVETRVRGEFELRFPARGDDDSLMIGAWTDRTIFVLEPGREVDQVPYFVPGTGGADERSGRMTLFLGTDVHSNLAGERVRPHGEGQEEVLFKALEPPEDLNTDAVYAAMLIDHDDDGVIDPDEFDYFRIGLGQVEQLRR
ncbi:hypothetical protein LZG04_30505 [Saccharothrix sp. S26]|uniref:hypothetical protein n=1 Tax=Saccharothrix sp. S26 TaxID=2907215 RepID=UPI001F36A59C|nr:hypothetical protein [Saccharothrix sp. S26]MCE6999104.1 hypothetical protein [Saccharothrix sp. S26]